MNPEVPHMRHSTVSARVYVPNKHQLPQLSEQKEPLKVTRTSSYMGGSLCKRLVVF